jgi:hypothetical protein
MGSYLDGHWEPENFPLIFLRPLEGLWTSGNIFQSANSKNGGKIMSLFGSIHTYYCHKDVWVGSKSQMDLIEGLKDLLPGIRRIFHSHIFNIHFHSSRIGHGN